MNEDAVRPFLMAAEHHIQAPIARRRRTLRVVCCCDRVERAIYKIYVATIIRWFVVNTAAREANSASPSTAKLQLTSQHGSGCSSLRPSSEAYSAGLSTARLQ